MLDVNISVESLINGIFSREEDCVEVATLDPEVSAELTEDETETIEAPIVSDDESTDESPDTDVVETEVPVEGSTDGAVDTVLEPIATDSELAEESANLAGEIASMNLALRTAEEFIFSQSTEAFDIKATWQKFWEMIKRVFEKIGTFLVTIWKRLQIFLAGDMKGITKWYTANKAAADAAEGNTSAKIKAKAPKQGGFKAMEDNFSKNGGVDKVVNEALASITSGSDDSAKAEYMRSEVAKTFNSKALNSAVFGSESPKAVEVTLKDLLAGASLGDVLSGVATIKTSMSDAQKLISANKKAVATAASTAKKDLKDDKEKIKSIKDLASATNTYSAAASNALIFLTMARITRTRQVYALCKRIVGKGAGTDGKK